jgi:hypothetical protein
MSKKSRPGDGQNGRGKKGLPVGEPAVGPVGFVKGLIKGLRRLPSR